MRKITQNIVIAAFCLISMVSLMRYADAQTCTLFVASNGSDTNPGTIMQPFKTIQKAANTVKAGDVVCVRAGVYPAFDIREKQGTANAPIVFKPYQGEKVTIDRYLGGGNGLRAIEFYGGSYITIDGFLVIDSDPLIDQWKGCNPRTDASCRTIATENFLGRNGIKMNSSSVTGQPHHLVLKNLEIHHNKSHAILGEGNNVQILYNRIYNNGGAAEGYGMYILGDSHLIKGNISYGNGGHGFRFGTGGKLLTNSVIEQNIAYNNGGTFVHSSPTTPLVTDGDGIIIYFGNNNIVRNNVSYNNIDDGIRIFAGNPTNNLVANNTVYGNGAIGIFVDGGVAEGGLPAGVNTVKNNIVYKNGLNAFDNLTGKSLLKSLLEKVEEFFVRTGGIKSDNLIGTDPKFVNVAGADFHLQASSPAIDAGTALSQVTVDFAGITRPQGSVYDIGAYEFLGQAAPPPPPPPAPTPPPVIPPPPSPKPPAPRPSPQPKETMPSPLSVSNLTVKQDGRSVIIHWTNPDHSDWKRSFLVKSKGEVPDFPGRGKVVYEGTKPEFVDRDLQPGQTYFYAVYTVGKTGSQSGPVVIEIQFEEVRERKATSDIPPQLEPSESRPIIQRIWKWFISLFGF